MFTYEAFAAAAISDPEDSGYAQDQADVANGVCPTSLRLDSVHLNAAGQAVAFAAAVAHVISVKGWAIENRHQKHRGSQSRRQNVGAPAARFVSP